ncbi:hypothetical protein PPYR_01044 [Photinus pyralis]|uniref:Uncharacterized protein n=1 Tax=Photinus pyralis TaxID=7054 RepID=A0A5N4B3D5_PHOPY|nr:hypothetical protein PPYR_01044 [Photinus pyralis]
MPNVVVLRHALNFDLLHNFETDFRLPIRRRSLSGRVERTRFRRKGQTAFLHLRKGIINAERPNYDYARDNSDSPSMRTDIRKTWTRLSLEQYCKSNAELRRTVFLHLRKGIINAESRLFFDSRSILTCN